MEKSYDLLIERISNNSGVGKEELERKIEARRAKLSGLISREGAAQIIAAELGVNFDNVQLKISEIVGGMKKTNLVGKVVSIFPVRSFNKNGRSGKVVNFIIADETGNARVVLWDTNHIDLIEKGEVVQGDVVEIKNAAVRDGGEIHLSGFSELSKSAAVITQVNTTVSFSVKTIEEVKEGNKVELRGIVVQVFPPRFFYVCSECGKKAMQEADGYSCKEHGKVLPKEKSLLNFVLDDGTETLRVVLFSDQLEKLISTEKLKDSTALADFKTDLLGTEISVSGSVRKNMLFNNLELTGQDIVKLDPDKLVLELEKN